MQTKPGLYRHYLFHVLLHEYLHSVGYLDEAEVRKMVHEVSSHYFGPGHVVTQLSTNLEKFLPNMTYPGAGFVPPENVSVEFVTGIDRKNLSYIS